MVSMHEIAAMCTLPAMSRSVYVRKHSVIFNGCFLLCSELSARPDGTADCIIADTQSQVVASYFWHFPISIS